MLRATDPLRAGTSLVPLHARAEWRPAWWLLGCRYTLLLTAEDSGGAYSLVQCFVPTRRGAPLRTHAREDETFHVVEGEVEFSTGSQITHAWPGSVVFAPRGVPHGFCNTGTADARLLWVATPGGLEHFLTDAGVPARDRTSLPPQPVPEDTERLLRAARHHGVVVHRAADDRKPPGTAPLEPPPQAGCAARARAPGVAGRRRPRAAR